MADWAERIPAAIEKAEREVRLHDRQYTETGAAFALDLTAGEVALAKALWALCEKSDAEHTELCRLGGACSKHQPATGFVRPALRAFVEKVEAL